MRKVYGGWIPLVVLCLGVAICAVPASAQPVDSFFDVFFEIDVPGELAQGGGDGWVDPQTNEGPWFRYDQGPVNDPPVPGVPWWWNQWFRNEDYKEGNRKVVSMGFDLWAPAQGQAGELWVTLNWSTPDYSIGNPDSEFAPPMPSEEAYIRRLDPMYFTYNGTQFTMQGPPGLGDVSLTQLSTNGGLHVEWDLMLPVDYNPEWLSIDVFGVNSAMSGDIFHDCVMVPEPASLSLLGLGVVALVLRRRKCLR